MRRYRHARSAGWFARYVAISLMAHAAFAAMVWGIHWLVQYDPGRWLREELAVLDAALTPRMPEDVDLEWVELPPELSKVTVPKLPTPEELEVALLDEKPEPPKVPPLEIKPIPIVPLPPPPPPPPLIPQPETKPAEKKQPKVEPIRKISVEVDDEKNVIDEPPPEAEFFSDKNRRVKEQTIADKTNLEQEMKGKAEASSKSEDTQSQEIGGADDKIAQLEDSEASSLDAKREEVASVHDGKDKRAIGLKAGELGDNGEKGEDGDGAEAEAGQKPGLLSMRDLQGRQAPGQVAPSLDKITPGDDGGLEVAESKDGKAGRFGKRGRSGKLGTKGPKLDLEATDYERIVGKEVADEELELARRTSSHRKGRWSKKLAQIRSSLENFVPNVRPGNQTELGTRAAPFALYLAKMHRQLHELWGFGFLEDLDDKGTGHPLNDFKLKVKMEIVVLSDGTIDDITIVEPSGQLTFDIAAVDTVHSAGPYGPTPEAIRSKNGKVYLHWTFHRNWYQCSNFFAEPFILDNPPADSDKHERGLPGFEQQVAASKKRALEQLNRQKGSATDGHVPMPHVVREPDANQAARARVAANVPTPDDPRAEQTALRWLNAFEKGNLGEMISVSAGPFTTADKVVAQDASGTAAVYRTLLAESRSRRVTQWKILSAAGYRLYTGRGAPAGDGTQRLYLLVKSGTQTFSLTLTPRDDGSYRVVGFDRL